MIKSFLRFIKVLALAFVLSGMSATLQAQNAGAVLKHAGSMLRTQDYSGAIALLEKNIKVFDTEGVRAVTAWRFLGLAYFSTGNYEKSEDYLRPFTERNLQYVVAYKEILSRLTRVYIELSDYRNVIRYSKMKIEIMERYKECGENYETGLADAYATMSHFYLYTRKYVQAEEAALKVLEINCMDRWAMCYFAYSLFFQRKMQEAEAMHTALLSPVGYNNDGAYDPYILVTTSSFPGWQSRLFFWAFV
jgi:tetratricopeptide (TPR) repeat protein